MSLHITARSHLNGGPDRTEAFQRKCDILQPQGALQTISVTSTGFIDVIWQFVCILSIFL